MSLTLEQFDRLSPRERYELIGLIWNSLPDDSPVVPTDWHLAELERRLDTADAEPDASESWGRSWRGSRGSCELGGRSSRRSQPGRGADA